MPFFEYETEEKEAADEGLAVIIEVESLQFDLGEKRLFGREPEDEDDEDILACMEEEREEVPPRPPRPGSLAQEGTDVYTLVSEGRLIQRDGLLQLTYTEAPEEEDAAPTKVCLAFPKENGNHVTVSRSGDMHTVFTVELNVRQYSTYETPFGQVDLCVIGKKIENNIGETGGTLRMDYAVELRGMITQRTKMMIRVRPEQEA